MITVVVVSYNRKQLLAKCLESLLKQKAEVPYEILVVDQGSTDGSIDLVQRYRRRSERLRLEVYAKPSANAKRNRGIELAKYDIIAFIDDDSVADPGWVSACVSAFQRDVLFVTGRILPLGPGYRRSTRESERPRRWGGSFWDRALCWKCGCSTNMALHRKVVDKIGRLDPRIGTGVKSAGCGDDTEYFYRAMVKGIKVFYFPEMLVYHQQSSSYEEYKKRTGMYYYGVAAFVRAKYPRHPSAIAMVLIRFSYAATVFLIHAFTFRWRRLGNDYQALRGSVRGVLGIGIDG